MVNRIDRQASGSIDISKITILSGIFNFKKETNITNDKYIPPEIAINSCIANDNGEIFISLVLFIWR